MKEGDLPSEQFEKLFEDINDFETAIVPIAKKVGIDFSKHIDTVGEMWEQPELTHPEVTCAGWSGDRVEEAIESVCCEYEAKLQDRKAAIADLDKVRVGLYDSHAKDKNQASIFNIQNSNIILGQVHQTGNLKLGDHTKIQEITLVEKQKSGGVKQMLKIIAAIVGFLAAFFTCLGYLLGWLGPIKEFIYKIVGK
jgi:hypothetical protein